MANDPETDALSQDCHKDERDLLLVMLLVSMRDTKCVTNGRIEDYLDGTTNIFALSDIITAYLLGAHTTAAYLGRRLAGNLAPLGLQDNQFAQTIMFDQAGYLSGFMMALSAGKYKLTEDGQLPADLLARIKLYVLRLRGAANEAWVRSLPPDTMINWVLGSAEHCGDCVELAAGSPYRASDMTQFPGDGTTKCLSNCDCEIETVDGDRGF